jgi:type IV/VI secretion system ImpK/VasF family protein
VIDDPMWGRVQIWMLVRSVFERAGELFRDGERLRDAALAGEPAPAPPPLYGKRRAVLRESLSMADAALTAYVGGRQRYQCLVALVAFLDERERIALGGLAEGWGLPPHQRELLDIDDGGDRFFDELADASARRDTHGLVLEIFLFCLRSGFVGRHRDHRFQLDQTVAELTERVRRDQPVPVAAVTAAPAARRPRLALIGFPVRTYVVAGGLVALLFAGLHLVSHREVVHSDLAVDCHYGEAVAGGAP